MIIIFHKQIVNRHNSYGAGKYLPDRINLSFKPEVRHRQILNTLNLIIDHKINNIKPVDIRTIVDIGCGAKEGNYMIKRLHDQYPSIKIFGTDIHSSSNTNVYNHNILIGKLPLNADLALMTNLHNHFSDSEFEKALHNIFDSLNQNGLLLIGDQKYFGVYQKTDQGFEFKFDGNVEISEDDVADSWY
ncbi:MAG: class I SAM-dependent methyltransferase [archaeon]